jgi:hypothetical protein
MSTVKRRSSYALGTHALPLTPPLQIPGFVHRADEHVSEGHHIHPFPLVLASQPMPVRQLRRSLGSQQRTRMALHRLGYRIEVDEVG